MATGDITSWSVPAATGVQLTDGWYIDVVIEGFTTGKAVDLGSGFNLPLDVSDIGSANVVLTVVSEGYDETGSLGTINRTLYAVDVLREEYPNEANDEEPTATSIRLLLNEAIYQQDKVAGSGTDPEATFAASTFRNDGGASETSNVETGLGVGTQGSTLVYPVGVAEWDWIAGDAHRGRIKGAFSLACNAYYGHGIAAVRFDVTGGTSAHTDNDPVETETATVRSATGLYMSAYVSKAFAVTSFSQGETITGRFRVYPRVGNAASIIDTDGNTTLANEVLGKNQHSLICDKSDLLDVERWVYDTGNDSNSGTSSGDPFATIGKALSDGANIIYCNEATHNPGNTNTRVTSSEWCIIKPEAGAAKANVIIELSSTRTYRHERLACHGVTMALNSTSSWLDGEHASNLLWFHDCDWVSGAAGKPTVGPGYRSHACYITNATGDLGIEDWHLQSFSSARIAYYFDGCEFNDTTSTVALNAWFRATACAADGNVAFHAKPSSNVAPVPTNTLFCNNTVFNFASTANNILQLGQSNGLPDNNTAVVGNVLEKTGATSAAVVIAGDNSNTSAQTTENIIFAHNTVAKERFNYGYNDIGTTGYIRQNWFIVGNSVEDNNIKADPFGTGSGNRTGGWPVLFSVNRNYNHHENATFPHEFDGLTVSSGSPGYVDAANGDFTPDTGSVLLAVIPAADQHITKFDLNGKAFSATADVGAIQVTTDAGTPQAQWINRRFTAGGSYAAAQIQV